MSDKWTLMADADNDMVYGIEHGHTDTEPPAGFRAVKVVAVADGSDPTAELFDDMRRIAGAANGIDPRIYRLIDEAERRAHNGSETIGRYQQLTKTDYPGTLERYIELGRVVVNA